MSKFYTNILPIKKLVSAIVALIIVHSIAYGQYTPNPLIKVNYFVQDGKMISSLGNNAGACIERLIAGFGANPTTTGNLEIRIHSIFKSSTGPTAATLNSCTGATASGVAGASGWSCENRCETASNAGKCNVWVLNGSQNASYPGNPNYTDTSSYPCTDILSYGLKGFESDGTSSTNLQDLNFNDGACGGTCVLTSCYGNYQTPTGGTNNLLIDIGSTSNNLAPFCGSNWSQLYQSDLESSVCTTDGFTNYYYSRWKYRWCWDASTLFDRHAGGIKVPNIKNYCSGANIAVTDSIEGFEVARGFASYQWEKNSGSGWTDIVGATSKDLATTSLTNATVNLITYQIRRATLFCTDFLATPTKTKVYSNIISVDVYPQPVAPSLYVAGTSPATGTTICKGLFVYAQFNPGTGGYTDATDLLQYSINNGLTWSNYTSGNSINTASATTAVLIRASRTSGSLSTCNAAAWTTLVNWPLSTVAIPPSITTSLPINNTSVCLAGTSQISGTITEGNGGTGFEYGYSINNGTTPTTIITGTPPSSNFTINTSGATTKINLFGRRTGVGAGTCSPTPWALIGEWQIVNPPNSPTLNTQIPTTASVAEGENISVTANNGSGGATDAIDEYRVSFDSGAAWSSYSVGQAVTVPNGAIKMIIQGRRNPGTSYGCLSSAWLDLASWNVNVILPIELISFTVHQQESVNQIKWITASELNSKEFIVLKSVDFNNWLEIGKVPASGNSVKIQYYQFEDNQILYPNNYYKLKIVDADNTFQYSKIISVENPTIANGNLVLYPNPTEANLKLIAVEGFSQFSLIKITDVLGKINKEIVLNRKDEKKEIEVDCSDIQKGTYYVCIYDVYGGLIKTLKLVKY